MLKVEQLLEMATTCAETAEKQLTNDVDDLTGSQINLVTCAIYTVGAEVCGRLDFIIRRMDGRKRKESDSKLDQESTGAADSSIRKERTGLKGPEGSDLR